MVRFPYTLEMWYEEDASQNPDGSWIEGAHEWRVIGRCNARQNGRAQQIKGQNGDAFLYSFEVTMPADTQPIPIGTKVRIFDSRGFNIFDRSLRTEAKPKDKDTASYPVQGFYKSRQPFYSFSVVLFFCSRKFKFHLTPVGTLYSHNLVFS